MPYTDRDLVLLAAICVLPYERYLAISHDHMTTKIQGPLLPHRRPRLHVCTRCQQRSRFERMAASVEIDRLRRKPDPTGEVGSQNKRAAAEQSLGEGSEVRVTESVTVRTAASVSATRSPTLCGCACRRASTRQPARAARAGESGLVFHALLSCSSCTTHSSLGLRTPSGSPPCLHHQSLGNGLVLPWPAPPSQPHQRRQQLQWRALLLRHLYPLPPHLPPSPHGQLHSQQRRLRHFQQQLPPLTTLSHHPTPPTPLTATAPHMAPRTAPPTPLTE